MYNRYVPQSDGSYKRSQIADSVPTPPRKPQSVPAPKEPEPQKEEQYCAPPTPQPRCRQCMHQRVKTKPQAEEKQSSGLFPFLRQLLPNDFDTGDLIVVLLLLLMSADNSEENNTALLTLALYLFL